MEPILYDVTTLDLILRLMVAMVLGLVIGMEREFARKTAGMRTHALVCLGSALFTILSISAFPELMGRPAGYDPTRIAAQIISGIGFLGAGMIIFSKAEERIKGLTTAASIWVVAAIGMAVGFGFYALALVATALVYLVLVVLWWVETKYIVPVAHKRKQRMQEFQKEAHASLQDDALDQDDEEDRASAHPS